MSRIDEFKDWLITKDGKASGTANSYSSGVKKYKSIIVL